MWGVHVCVWYVSAHAHAHTYTRAHTHTCARARAEGRGPGPARCRKRLPAVTAGADGAGSVFAGAESPS